MRTSEEFGHVVQQIVGKRSPRDVAAEAGVSPTTVYEMLQGRIKVLRIIERFADRQRLAPETRVRLFEAAGYIDPRADSEAGRPGELPSRVRHVARKMVKLNGKQLRGMEYLAEEPSRLDAVIALLDPRVKNGGVASEALA